MANKILEYCKKHFGEGNHLQSTQFIHQTSVSISSPLEDTPNQDLDLEPIIESTSDGISIDNRTIHGGYKQSNPSQNPTYHTLMNEFGLLAEVDCCWGSSPPPIEYFQILLVVTHMEHCISHQPNYCSIHFDRPWKLYL